ncbi:MAG TPA: hypothetical protein DCQ06_13625 [Myxococcales bacterium]|nr:hypothetical protein [Myxococcales bacterium]
MTSSFSAVMIGASFEPTLAIEATSRGYIVTYYYRHTRSVVLALCLFFASGTWATPAQAKQHKGEVGLQLGGLILDSATGLGDAHWRYDVPGGGFALTLRGGYMVMPRLTVEGTLRWSYNSMRDAKDFDQTGQEIDFLEYKTGGGGSVVGLRALARYDLLADQSKKFQPFVSAGLGFDTFSSDKAYVRQDLDTDWALQFGVGATYPVYPKLKVRVDLNWFVGEPAVTRGGEQGNATHNFEILVGVSYGLSFGKGDSDKDGVLDSEDNCPHQAEDKDNFKDADGCPDPDNDGDGVLDSADRCPRTPEDKDGYRDGDGCPDLDNDSDGVADAKDKCPNKAEDRDGFADTDGCPDLDNDGDGVADAKDKCPNKKEDRDGFQDADGCPDPDNDFDGTPDVADRCKSIKGPADNAGCPRKDSDGDGVADDKDQCPKQAETYNGDKDADGCPDGAALVKYSEGQFVMSGGFDFKKVRQRLGRKSKKLVASLVASIQAHSEVASVTSSVYTTRGGDEKSSLILSQARADAIKAALVKRGVKAARLMAKGVGSKDPACADVQALQAAGRKKRRALEKCHAANDRATLMAQ